MKLESSIGIDTEAFDRIAIEQQMKKVIKMKHAFSNHLKLQHLKEVRNQHQLSIADDIYAYTQ